ncbi:MAG TPA: SUMF1/EgtB/PvdO family nonheme iron enzyme, partial [Bacteroidia bacterium]|nr:SUMF1/EgtB/PvdO family nonheme iron enzyme [Bacteroidia bacterium]
EQKTEEKKPEPPTMATTLVEGSAEKKKPDMLVANPLENQVKQGQVKLTSHPTAATVLLGDREIGVTETKLLDLDVGPVELVFRREGYRDFVYRGEVKEGTQVVSATLLPDLGPKPGLAWVNSLGMPFVPLGDGHHESAGEISLAIFDRFLEESEKEIPRVGQKGLALVSQDPALWEFCDWLASRDRHEGYLAAGQYYRPQRALPGPEKPKGAFKITVEHESGVLALNSEPSGARAFRDGEYLGTTPLVLDGMRLGSYRIELFKPGFATAIVEGDLLGADPEPLVATLQPDGSAVFGKRWTNSQGMELVPIGDLLVATTETPIRSYLDYLIAQKMLIDATTPLEEMNYPAAGVSHATAVAFCEWLTIHERRLGLIRPWQQYRLPTDLEWSQFVGLTGESGKTPEARNRATDRFPWGTEWPPPPGAGNFADLSATGVLGGKVVQGYDDGFPMTSPVGSFGAAANGLHDLAGNVWEWVQDAYTDGSDGLQVARGGGWNSSEPETLSITYRNPVPSGSDDNFYGFRYVLEDAYGGVDR